MAYSVPDLAISATGLVKRFGSAVALDGLDLAVPRGTVCGLLGPNGAGKTTAVRILSTLLRFDAGRASVAGFDVASQASEVRFRIGLTSQHDAVEDALTGRQNLEMFGRLYHLSPRAARRRADELLERFGLTDAARRPAKQYSGGMRRRLDLAASFVLAPRVLFLDEPTTGQDPRNRNEVWDVVRSFVAEGTTVLLTTHYLDEADSLCDSISVVDDGRVIASGTPASLKSRLGGSQIDVVVRDPACLGDASHVVARVCGRVVGVDEDRRLVTGAAGDAVATLAEVLAGLAAVGVEAEDVALRRPTLDEVFLSLTGRPAAPPDDAPPPGASGGTSTSASPAAGRPTTPRPAGDSSPASPAADRPTTPPPAGDSSPASPAAARPTTPPPAGTPSSPSPSADRPTTPPPAGTPSPASPAAGDSSPSSREVPA